MALWDSLMGVYTAANSMAFEDYDSVDVRCVSRKECRDEAGVLRAFEDWEAVSETLWTRSVDQSWSFRMLSGTIDAGELYAVFEVTDSQANRYCSEPRPLRTRYAAPDEIFVTYDDGGLLTVNRLSLSDGEENALLSMDVKNISPQEAFIRMEGLEINGKKTALSAEVYGSGANDGLMPDEEQPLMVSIPASILTDAGPVTDLQFQLLMLDAAAEEIVGAVSVSAVLQWHARPE